MNRKSLILAILLVLLVFISASAVSAADDVNTISADETSNAQEVTVVTTDTNDQIQEKINALNDGDTLNFEKGDYKNISLYVNKSITINGNGANLYGYDTLSADHINPIIYNKTTTTDPNEIVELKLSFEQGKNYEVMLDYGTNGLVNKVTIKDIK